MPVKEKEKEKNNNAKVAKYCSGVESGHRKEGISLSCPCGLSSTIFQSKELKDKIPENQRDKICERSITEECQLLLREK